MCPNGKSIGRGRCKGSGSWLNSWLGSLSITGMSSAIIRRFTLLLASCGRVEGLQVKKYCMRLVLGFRRRVANEEDSREVYLRASWQMING